MVSRRRGQLSPPDQSWTCRPVNPKSLNVHRCIYYMLLFLVIYDWVPHSNPMCKFSYFSLCFHVSLEIIPVPILEICDNFICVTDLEKFENFTAIIVISCIVSSREFKT